MDTMARKPKTPKLPTVTRKILGNNVELLMRREYRGYTNMPEELAKNAGTSQSTIERIIAAQIGTSVDTVERIAKALGVSVYQLFIPNLSPANPQVVKGATLEEERLYSMVAHTVPSKSRKA